MLYVDNVTGIETLFSSLVGTPVTVNQYHLRRLHYMNYMKEVQNNF